MSLLRLALHAFLSWEILSADQHQVIRSVISFVKLLLQGGCSMQKDLIHFAAAVLYLTRGMDWREVDGCRSL